MKKLILTLMFAVFGLFTTGQGKIAYSKPDLMKYLKEKGGEYEKSIQGNGGEAYLDMATKEYYIQYFFDENNEYVDFTIYISFTSEAFAGLYEALGSEYIKINDSEWRNYFEGGIIYIKTEVLDDYKYPVFIVTWALD